MTDNRFDEWTKKLAGRPVARGFADGIIEWIIKILRALINWLLGLLKGKSRDQFPGTDTGRSPEELEQARLLYVKTRTVEDIPRVAIEPKAFLQSLEEDSRQQFLAVLRTDQYKPFLQLKSSVDFFELLDPDQRATIAVLYRPQFKVAHPAPLQEAGFRRPPPLYAQSYMTRTAQPNKVNGATAIHFNGLSSAPGSFDRCEFVSKLQWNSCYYSYTATAKIDRDGSPCTYGPYPCGTSKPPDPPGHVASPFCVGSTAPLFGCDNASTQVAGIADCSGSNTTGTPLEKLCNATNLNPSGGVTCDYGSSSPGLQPLNGNARYTSVITNGDIPGCIIDHYKDPLTGVTIKVPVKTDVNGDAPCIQQSEPNACGGINCPCPGLYISTTSSTHGFLQMNPNNYTNAITARYISVPLTVGANCQFKPGMFVLVSKTYDANSNPTENPNDWVAGILGDYGGKGLGEMSYAMSLALGNPGDHDALTFRVYPQLLFTLPITNGELDGFKMDYLGVCCPGKIEDQCHKNEGHGVCITDLKDPNAGSCSCQNGWLLDRNGDCTMYCPGSDGHHYVGSSTDTGYLECAGNGHCNYDRPDAAGYTMGNCVCDTGWWGFLGDSCDYRDCVKLEDWENVPELPCYGNGVCSSGRNINEPGNCDCYDGWTNGSTGYEYCSEKDCHHACSGHGTCVRDDKGVPYCDCDYQHGWYGEDCSLQGCVTDNGSICNGHGNCFRNDQGVAECYCPGEWGGGWQSGPNACGTRACPNCPAGVALCSEDWDWVEALTLCIAGNHCQSSWNCRCMDDRFNPPTCSNKKCCNDFWGQCNTGLTGTGLPGGGICLDSGVCQCFNNYDPDTCCGKPLPSGSIPNGFGKPCPGAGSSTFSVQCGGPTAACGACVPGSATGSFILTPDGNDYFHDQIGNKYHLDEKICRFQVVNYAPTSNAGICNANNDDGFLVLVNGKSGTGLHYLICPTDCSSCNQTIACTITLS